ncbi:MAG: ABC transporter ATP-binding protein [Janthinobacterium lividum]
MSLKIAQLCVRYGETLALRDVSIEVGQGEVVALIGSNGAGKSSMLNTTLGLLRHSSGEIRFGTQRLDALTPRERIAAGLSLSPEGRRVFGELTVDENLDLGDLGRDLARRQQRRHGIYELFPRLLERRAQKAGTMSGGEQQMLAIGRAMMAAPKVLMLDEPTLGLAPIIVQEIVTFIRRIRADGISVLLAEQNAEMALSVADRAYVLQNGARVMAGSARELSAHPDVRSAYLGI